MGKKTKKVKRQITEQQETLVVELPSVPNFPYVPRETEPPKNVVLILATESGYVLGHWDGVYFFDPYSTKIESSYGKVFSWCILLDMDQEAVHVEEG